MKKRLIVTFICFALLLSAICANFTAFGETSPISVSSKEAILISETGETVFEHNADAKRPIASMTKIMTLLCVYDAIEGGAISLDDDVVVSANAASMGGSQVFLDANTTHKVENLIKSIVVCSANDSCVALAEHVAGSVESFVARMNDKCQQLGLRNTKFSNCTGLPAADHYSSARDVSEMMRQLIKHPHYFTCSGIWMEDYVHPDGRVTGMTNTNKLIRFYDGCDAGKTGFTSEAQHCLSATAKRGSTRFIAVVVGAPDSKTRFAEVSNMFNYGFANYESKVYAQSEVAACKAYVRCSKESQADVYPQNDLVYFGKKGSAECEINVELGDVVAPLQSGAVVGKIHLVKDGQIVATQNLVVKSDLHKKEFFDYLKDIVL